VPRSLIWLGGEAAQARYPHAEEAHAIPRKRNSLSSAWSRVAAATSGVFADHHHEVVWPAALLLDLAAYGLPAILLRLCVKRATILVRVGVVSVWTAFYLASLFVLFPAPDGP